MSDSELLYKVSTAFYSGQYDTVLVHEAEATSGKPLEYVLRSYLALGDYKAVLSKTSDTDALYYFASYKKSPEKESVSSKFDEFIASHGADPLTQIYGSIYIVNKTEDYGKALELLTNNLNLSSHDDLTLEICSLVVQLYLLNNQLAQAKTFLNKFAKININDSIVYSYAESLFNLVKGGEKAYQHTFYFFEEISSSNKSLKNLVYLLTIHLVMKHFDESAELLSQIDDYIETSESVGLDKNADYANYLVNKVATLITNNQSEAAHKLIKEEILPLKNHPFVTDYNSKMELFDEVVAKYSV